MKISFLQRLLDLTNPRACAICGQRLAVEETLFCTVCLLHLPLTHFHTKPDDNPMTQIFWGLLPIEKASALIYYTAHATSSYPVYKLKYMNVPEMGIELGRYMGRQLCKAGFFNEIDAIIPVPLTQKHQRQRGYNQSQMIAEGIAEECHLPIWNNVVKRNTFHSSQTNKGRIERASNVKGVFKLIDVEKIKDAHVLIVDDVVTTGATICSLGQELRKVEGVKISVVSVGFANDQR